jgi:hypothetical protein
MGCGYSKEADPSRQPFFVVVVLPCDSLVPARSTIRLGCHFVIGWNNVYSLDTPPPAGKQACSNAFVVSDTRRVPMRPKHGPVEKLPDHRHPLLRAKYTVQLGDVSALL